jgi:catechol 2,3-dioxygenase-like lactoylglutathione lyase family enzyme
LVVTQLVTPQLRSTNWQRTRAFYEDGLGFRVQWTHQFAPHLPVFAEVARGPLSLFLTEHAGDCQVGGAAYIIVDDVDAYFEEIRSRGIAVLEPPEDSPWETREMSVMDPDGNRLRFANRRQ